MRNREMTIVQVRYYYVLIKPLMLQILTVQQNVVALSRIVPAQERSVIRQTNQFGTPLLQILMEEPLQLVCQISVLALAQAINFKRL